MTRSEMRQRVAEGRNDRTEHATVGDRDAQKQGSNGEEEVTERAPYLEVVK
jgi:hypothetical protein